MRTMVLAMGAMMLASGIAMAVAGATWVAVTLGAAAVTAVSIEIFLTKRIERHKAQRAALRYHCTYCGLPEAEFPYELCPACRSTNSYTLPQYEEILGEYERQLEPVVAELKRSKA